MPGKRKADTEKSSNIHTQRVQKRRKQMTRNELVVDNAKRADAAAIVYQVKKLKKSSEWITADLVQQASMVQKCKDKVIHKRKVDQVHHSCIEKQIGIGIGGGAYATWDDGNPAWQTEDEDDDDPTQEALWRADDTENGEIMPNFGSSDEDLREKNRKQAEGFVKGIKALQFKIWKRNWTLAYNSIIRLTGKINRDPDFLAKLPPAIDPTTCVYYEHTPPHMFFTEMEKAAWRNFTAWNLDNNEITLPGPLEWWPEGYDSIQHGFFVPQDAIGSYRAWEMLQEEEEPADFAWVLPSSTELIVLPQTIESIEYLKAFYLK